MRFDGRQKQQNYLMESECHGNSNNVYNIQQKKMNEMEKRTWSALRRRISSNQRGQRTSFLRENVSIVLSNSVRFKLASSLVVRDVYPPSVSASCHPAVSCFHVQYPFYNCLWLCHGVRQRLCHVTRVFRVIKRRSYRFLAVFPRPDVTLGDLRASRGAFCVESHWIRGHHFHVTTVHLLRYRASTRIAWMR